jgi:hypothetical protein
MPKYTFTVSGSQLIVSLVPAESDVQPTSMSYLAPSFKIGVGKINAYEYGQPKQSFLFTEIGEIDGVEPTDLQDAFDKLTALTANFNGGGAAPYKVYTALLTQSGTDAPVATVLENTLGNIVWSYESIGSYNGTLAGAFIENKTFTIITNCGGQEANYYINDNNINYVGIATSDGVEYTDELLFKTPIEIRVYN